MVQALRTTRVRGDETRARILAAAMNLFATLGFGGTSMRAIARDCLVTDAAPYYYFPSKRKVLEALWAERLVEVPRMPPLPVATREDLRERLETGFAFWVENDMISRVVWRLALENDTGALGFRERWMQANRETLAPALTALYGERGRVITEALVAMLSGIAMDAMLRYGKDFPDVVRQPAFRRRASELIDLLLPESSAGKADGAA